MSVETIQVDKVFPFQNVYIRNLRKGIEIKRKTRKENIYICDRVKFSGFSKCVIENFNSY